MAKIPRSKQKSHLADMSLPPEQRRRKRKTTRKKGKGGKGATAQMSHGNSSYGTKARRDFERKHGRDAPAGDTPAPQADPSPEPEAT